MVDKYVVSSAPHLGKEESIPLIMWRVNMALLPAALVGIGIFGPAAFALMAVTILTAVVTEGAPRWTAAPS
jgi:electron transport complex protein RnfD